MNCYDTVPTMQAIKGQIEQGDMSFSIVRVVTDAAAVAVQKPAKVFLPIVTASNVLRTITLATQIVVESNVLTQMHWIASEPLCRKSSESTQRSVLAHRDCQQRAADDHAGNPDRGGVKCAGADALDSE